jgi:hypothetical protein
VQKDKELMMPKLFDDLITEEQETAKAFAKEHKIDLELAAVIIRSSDEHEKRLDALKVLRASAKPVPKKQAVAEQIKKAQAEYDKLEAEYKSAKSQPISAMNRSLVAIKNDMHKKAMELKQLDKQI